VVPVLTWIGLAASCVLAACAGCGTATESALGLLDHGSAAVVLFGKFDWEKAAREQVGQDTRSFVNALLSPSDLATFGRLANNAFEPGFALIVDLNAVNVQASSQYAEHVEWAALLWSRTGGKHDEEALEAVVIRMAANIGKVFRSERDGLHVLDFDSRFGLFTTLSIARGDALVGIGNNLEFVRSLMRDDRRVGILRAAADGIDAGSCWIGFNCQNLARATGVGPTLWTSGEALVMRALRTLVNSPSTSPLVVTQQAAIDWLTRQ